MDSMLATKIRSLRQLRNWTQSELAQKAMISRSYVSELERGTREPTVGIMKSIADALEAPVETFFDNVRDLRVEEVVPMMPPELKSFIASPESVDYIQVALKARNLGVGQDVLEDIVEALSRGR